MNDEMTITINADTSGVSAALGNLEKLSQSFGRQLGGALKSAAVDGRSLEDILRRIGLNLAGMALEQGLQPLRGLAGSLLTGLVGSFARIAPFAKGGVPGRLTAFASGGIVSQPTYFPMATGTGLMGEAGAEAILPLRRGSDGTLCVATRTASQPVQIVMNIQTPDVAGFRRSEAQVTGALARAVSRGMRSL